MSYQNFSNAKVVVLDTDEIMRADDARIYHRTLSDRALTVLLTIVQTVAWGSRWSSRGEHVLDVYSAIVDELLFENKAQKTQPIVQHAQIVENHADEEAEELPQYQKFNDIWYIGFPCGDCGGVQWVELGAGVDIDPATGGPTTAANTSASIAASSNEPCAAAAVTDYSLNRFRQWMNALSGTVAVALDEVFAGYDELVDIASVFLQKADNQSVINRIASYAEDELYNNVAAQRAAIIASYPNFTGKVTRLEMQSWLAGSVGKWTIEGQALITWLDNTLLFGLSADIAKLVADCNNSEQVIVPLLPATTPTAPTVVTENLGDAGNGQDVYAHTYAINRAFACGETFTTPEQYTNITGYSIAYTTAPTEDGNSALKVSNVSAMSSNAPELAGPYSHARGAGEADILQTKTGLTFAVGAGYDDTLSSVRIEYECQAGFTISPVTIASITIYTVGE